MNNPSKTSPEKYKSIIEKSQEIHFEMYSQEDLGILLRFLTASKKEAWVLELGKGTGLALSWILDGLGAKGVVVSVEKEAQYLELAASFFGEDSHLQLVHQDAHLWVNENKKARFDLIFADTLDREIYRVGNSTRHGETWRILCRRRFKPTAGLAQGSSG